jgi:hypothetical protein
MTDTIPAEAVERRAFVVAQLATDGSPHAFGRVVSYTDRPTYQIELADGRQISWVADLCRYAEPDEIEIHLGLSWGKS